MWPGGMEREPGNVIERSRPLLTVDQIAHSTLPSEETSCRRFGIDHLLS